MAHLQGPAPCDAVRTLSYLLGMGRDSGALLKPGMSFAGMPAGIQAGPVSRSLTLCQGAALKLDLDSGAPHQASVRTEAAGSCRSNAISMGSLGRLDKNEAYVINLPKQK